MMPFKLFLERKQRNPLRKAELISSGELDYLSPEFFDKYRNYYKKYPPERMDDDNDRVIKKKYENLLKSSEELANKYLDSEIRNLVKYVIRQSTKGYKKIYEFQGVQVFLDEANVGDIDYSPGSYNYRMVKHSVLVMLVYVRDILPNRKPKIVITSLKKNPYTSRSYDINDPSSGMAGDKLIYIDEMYVDDNAIWVHEYAHWVVDLIPTQTQDMLIKAFRKFIDLYYKGSKLRNPTKRGKELSETEKIKIANKLGFPEYGLTNHDEFFAVLIENWKQLPNNKLTYKFKSLVKNILARL